MILRSTALHSKARKKSVAIQNRGSLCAGIRVNAIRPGIVQTNIMGEGMTEDSYNEFASGHHLIKRAGKPEEIAKLAAFLLSEDGSFMTASLHDVDGGFAVVAN